jgi:hypothetical protein
VNGTNQQARNDRGPMEIRGTMTGRIHSSAGGLAADRPPDPAPALSQLLNRMEDTNSRMIDKCNCLQAMNDRLLGNDPETAHNDGKVDTVGAIVAQLERQIMIYEMIVTRFGCELDRLSRV